MVSIVPTRSPMGLMLISAPRVKNRMPTMIMAAPSRKQSRMLGEMGATVKQSTSTMATMGSTACNASSSFSRSLGRDALRMLSTDLSQPFPAPEAPRKSVQFGISTRGFINSIRKNARQGQQKSG